MKYRILLLGFIVIIGFLLRFIDVSSDPPGLYIDEASIGYNAYTILKTGKDEYGIPHPLWFKSFGDYKVPVYIYTVAGSMAVFGKTELAIRIPSVIAGTLMILVFYLFLDKLLELEIDKKLQTKLKYLPLLGAFLLAISTWSLQFSRGGFEVNLGTLFYLLGCYLFLLFKQQHKALFISLAVVLFILAIYTYDSFRILSPLALLFIAFEQKFYRHKKSYFLIIAALLLCLPIVLFSLTSQGSERLTATTAFSQPGHFPSFFYAPLIYLNNYLSFFSLDFLFNFGDGIGRHQVPNFGELYRWQIPFFFAGIIILLRQKKSIVKYSVFLLFLSTPLAGAIAQPSPHALRSLPLVIPCLTFISIGLLYFFENIKRYKVIVAIAIILIAGYEFCLYLDYYYIHYPRVNMLDWGASYKQLVQTTEQQKHNYKHIVIDSNLTYAPVYFHFYDNTLSFTLASPSWRKPASWGNSPVLYIRPYYGQNQGTGLVDTVYLANINHDIFAQLWNLK